MAVTFHTDPAVFAAAARDVAARSPSSEALVAVPCASLARHPPAEGAPLVLAPVESDGARAPAIRHGPNDLPLEDGDPGAQHLFQTTDAANPVSTAICARVGCRPVDETVGYDFVAP